MSWPLVYTTQAKRDAKKLSRSGLKPQAQKLLGILAISANSRADCGAVREQIADGALRPRGPVERPKDFVLRVGGQPAALAGA